MWLFLFIVAILAFIVGTLFPKTLTVPGQGYNAQPTTKDLTPTRNLIRGVSAGVAIVSVLFMSFYTVSAGQEGVCLTWGRVTSTLEPGPHLVVPFMQRVDILETRTQRYNDENASAASSDLQVVHTSIAVNFHIDPAQVGALYSQLGPTYAARVIDPTVQECLKSVTAKSTAEALVTNREMVKGSVQDLITSRLAPYHIIVEPNGVSITNFNFSDDYNKAIEAKQVASQQAEQQKYELQKATLAAQTQIATAEGEAKAAQVKAAALQAQGGEKLLAQMWIQKWDGKLPQFTSGGGQYIVDLKSLLNSGSGATATSK